MSIGQGSQKEKIWTKFLHFISVNARVAKNLVVTMYKYSYTHHQFDMLMRCEKTDRQTGIRPTSHSLHLRTNNG